MWIWERERGIKLAKTMLHRLSLGHVQLKHIETIEMTARGETTEIRGNWDF
jgi:hypothetical protein